MLQKAVSTITLIVFIFSLDSCYSRYNFTPEELRENPEAVILGIVTIDGQVIEFKNKIHLKDGIIKGILRNKGEPFSIPLLMVRRIAVPAAPDIDTRELGLTLDEYNLNRSKYRLLKIVLADGKVSKVLV